MKNWPRFIPYLVLALVAIIIFLFSTLIEDGKTQIILDNIFSSSIFFFIFYLFYDLINQSIKKKERKYLSDYITNKISNDIFVALYFLRKILHGYNLDSSTIDNIINVVNYPKSEILNAVKNQSYLGFQIFKNTDEVRSLFWQSLNDNFILKYSDHIDSINLLRISNNLAILESLLKDETNFDKSAESGIEYIIVNGKDINPKNDDGLLLLKKTQVDNRFVVYDSGYFEEENNEYLLNRYILKNKAAPAVSELLYEIFILMKHWLPKKVQLAKNEPRFRIIKEYFNPNTYKKLKDKSVFVADIIEINSASRS